MKKLLLLLLFLPLSAAALSDWAYTDAEQEQHKLRQTAEKRAFKQVKAEVKAGFSDSLADLADLYYNGIGTKQNYKKAYKYYQQAAQKGDAYAAYSQAFMQMYGQGVKKDPQQAFKQMQTLAQEGSSGEGSQEADEDAGSLDVPDVAEGEPGTEDGESDAHEAEEDAAADVAEAGEVA